MFFANSMRTFICLALRRGFHWVILVEQQWRRLMLLKATVIVHSQVFLFCKFKDISICFLLKWFTQCTSLRNEVNFPDFSK